MRSHIAEVVRTVRRSLPADASDPRFECADCRFGYDRSRLNCPACGGPVRDAK